MKRKPAAGAVPSLRKVPGILFGVIFGVFLAASSSPLWADSDELRGATKRLLYAISILAVDTEVNAEHIVELRQRVNDLEVALAKIPAPKN